MLNTRIAESILGLVSSPDRAASTVGDLLETAPGRGAVWFWWAVLRTAVAQVWSQMTERPVRVTGSAFVGLAIDYGASAAFAFLTGIFFFTVAYRNGHAIRIHEGGWQVWWGVHTLITLATSFLVGRLLARWAPGREVAASLTYVVLYVILDTAYDLTVDQVYRHGLFSSRILIASLVWAMPRMLAVAGAAWGRHRRLALR